MKNGLMLSLTFALFALSAIHLSSCAEVRNRGRSIASRGSVVLQEKLALGATPLHSQYRATALSADGSDSSIVSISTDSASHVWSRVVFDTRLTDAIKGDDDFEAISRAFIASHASDLGFLPSEIKAGDTVLHAPLAQTKVVNFRRQFGNALVNGAFIQFFYTADNRGLYHLSEINNNSYGPIESLLVANTLPTDQEAVEATGIPELTAVARNDLIQPVLQNDGRYTFAKATEFSLRDSAFGSTETLRLIMDNMNRNIHQASTDVTEASKTITAETFKLSYILKELKTSPLAFAKIGNASFSISSDSKGQFEFDSGSVLVQLATEKSAAKIVDLSLSNKAYAQFPLTLSESGAAVKMSQANPAALNAFVAIQTVADFVAPYLTPKQLPLLTTGIQVNVNDSTDSCNANYKGLTQSLNFYAQGTPRGRTCANTGLMNDVIYHEWGHAMDDQLGIINSQQSYRTGITDSVYSEAIGDILSSYLRRSPLTGAGMTLNDTREVRNLLNHRKYPPLNETDAEIHTAGQIVGGAFWDMFVSFQSVYGVDRGADLATKLFLSHLLISDRYLDAYAAVLRIDDDDSNAATRSPNYCKITRAFQAHNLSGAEKAGDDCVDADPSLKIRIDIDRGDGKVNLIASAYAAAKIVACPGFVKVCKAGSAGYVEMLVTAPDGVMTQGSDRHFYTSKSDFDLKTNPSYSFFSLDSNSLVKGIKSLRFTAKAE